MEKLKLIIPTSWDEITLRQYEQISQLKPGDNETENLLSILVILCRLTDAELKCIPLHYYAEIFSGMEWISVTPEPKLIDSIKIKGELYNVNKNWNNLTFGEAISIEQLLMDNKVDANSYGFVLACLLRKPDTTFNAGQVMELLEVIKDELTITEVLGLMLGFSNGENNYTTINSQVYSSL